MEVRGPDLDVDAVVVGAGLIGSAAARHLARAGRRVALVGAPEPEESSSDVGVRGSHYDEARITRIADPDPVWADLARRSIRTYAELQRASGIPFHEPRGFLRVAPAASPILDRVAAVARDLGTRVERLDGGGLRGRFPLLRFPSNMHGVVEGGAAGIVNPRAMLRAQLALFAAAGGIVVRDTAVLADREGGRWEVATRAGALVRGRDLLLATGAFVNRYEIAPAPLPVRVEVETVWLGRVAGPDVAGAMPGLWHDMDWHPTIPHVYVLPPVPYPDGHHYMKIGADHDPDVPLDTLEDVTAFFVAGGSAERGFELQGLLATLMPDVSFDGGRCKPCILCYTDSGLPIVDRVSEGCYVAVGGNGAAAKSSDEIGRMAAALVRHGRWTHDLDARTFKLA